MTPRRAGTASNSKAFHESTMYLPSCGTFLSRIGTDPEASTTCLASKVFSVPSGLGHEHFVSGQQPPMPLNADHAVGLEQRRDAAGHGLDHGCAALLHGGEIERELADLDAVDAEFILGALVQLG